VYFHYLALRLWKSVVTLAVTEITNCGKIFLRRSMNVCERHRLPLTGSRCDIRWLIRRRAKPTFFVFPVCSMTIMEKYFDACGDVDYYFRPVFSASEGAGVLVASIAVDGSR
jgi:hypothetical protein